MTTGLATGRVSVVVVTFNRVALLLKCLHALAAQTRPPDQIIVIDNASTDRTAEELDKAGWLARPDLRFVRLPSNSGGAGGFQRGVSEACARGAGWIWLMDDDALPEASALAELLRAAKTTGNVYGSLAVNGDFLCWPISSPGSTPKWPIRASEVPAQTEARFLPFLGFLVHHDLVSKIGLPDADYFIAADDIEYSLRAQRAGAQMISVAASRIEHPRAELEWIPIGNRRLSCLRLAPWKRYYDTRNRLLNAKTYFGSRVYTEVLPGTLVRMAWVLARHPQRMQQARAFFAALLDGLRGVKGCRHSKWGLQP